MRPLSTRTAGFTDSIIRRMTRISNKYGAINLSQGFPDFDPPREITDRLAEIAPSGPHQYAITWGAQNFRAPSDPFPLCQARRDTECRP
ncbi:MAG: hypothetical protein IJ059_02740 [Prevotella sp.]|nr:hypothetical protein [Prevotella sp.]